MISPIVDVKVSFDKSTQNYTYKYKYKLTNLSSAKISIRRFILESSNAPITIKNPKGWRNNGFDIDDKKVQWVNSHLPDNIDYTIKPGKSLDGFKVISKSPPGLVIMYSQGDTEVKDLPTIIFDTDEEARKGDDESISCPGWYRGGGIHGGEVVTFTTGPAIPNRVEAKIRIKRSTEKKWKGAHNEEPDLEISPLDTGKIQLLIFGDKDIDVTKIDLTSLTFGRGNAKPTKTLILSEFKDDSDNEIKEHLKKHKGSNLLLEFNLQDVDVKCDIDHALFLNGKIGTKDLIGAAKIKHVGCDKKTFSREAKKIRGSSDLYD